MRPARGRPRTAGSRPGLRPRRAVLFPSVPAPAHLGAQHLVVDIGAPVAKDLVVLVPVALATGVGQVRLGVDNLLSVGAGRAADGPARVAYDEALADERLTALHAGAGGGGDGAMGRARCRGRGSLNGST